jgi:hypothetical protein
MASARFGLCLVQHHEYWIGAIQYLELRFNLRGCSHDVLHREQMRCI